MSNKYIQTFSNSEEINAPDNVVQDILNTFTDLRHYSREIENELRTTENESINIYINESENIASLHNQISACDNILERMETMLLEFQNDLGSISTEILTLQRKSISMSQELTNRQAIRGQLSQFIDDIAVPETLILGIMDQNVTEQEFLNQLQVLNHKIGFIKEQSFKDTKSCQDVKDILEKLRIKAMNKIRIYLLEQINKFHKPLSNYQIPQNAMLKYKGLFEFLLSNERNIAEEISSEYVDTMSKIYYSYFKSYEGRIMKLQFEETTTKDDLMGIQDTATRNIFNKSLRNKATVFTIGNRGEVLSTLLEAPILVPHTETRNKYPYEALFRSVHYALVDNACREYLFACEFFYAQNQRAKDIFNAIMGKTLGLLQIARRYAEYSAALVSISENFPNELINKLLAELQEEVEMLIFRMAGAFSERKDQLIFLINNYDMILNIIMERTRDNSKEAETFKARLTSKSGEYVEEILYPYFGEIIQFVKEFEYFCEKALIDDIKAMEPKSVLIVQNFCLNWKKSLEELNREILLSFPNLVTGYSLLQLALTQLVQYYHRFHKSLTPNVRTNLVNIHLIMVEMKKYKTNY